MFEFCVRSFAWGFDTSLKAALIALIASALLKLLRFQDSNIRHRVWTGVLAGMLFLPLLTAVVPALRLPVVPSAESLLAWTSEPLAAEFAGETTRTAIDSRPLIQAEIVAEQQNLSIGPGPFENRRQLSPGELQSLDSLPTAEPPIDSVGRIAAPADADQPIAASGLSLASSSNALSRQTLFAWCLSGIAALWLTGSVFFAFRLIAGLWLAVRLRQRSAIVDRDALSVLVENPQQGATVRECLDIWVPLTVGALRPQILLPPDWRAWPLEKLRAVLAHEQMHVQRADCLVALVAEINCSVYWFHPLAWWLKQQLAVLAEQACDDAAIDSIGDRTLYARHLLEVAADALRHRGRFAPAGVSMARRASVETRIHAILDFTRPLTRSLTWAKAILLLAVMVPLIALAAALQPPAREQPEAKPADKAANGEPVAAEKSKLSDDSAQLPAEDAMFTFAGSVVDDRGQPVAGAKVSFGYLHHKQSAGNPPHLATTDEQGKFQFSRKRSELIGAEGHSGWVDAGVIATKEGYGFAIGAVQYFDASGQLDAELTEREREIIEYEYGKRSTVLTLVSDDVPIRGRILNAEGQPIAGAKIELASIWQGKEGTLETWLAASAQPGAERVAADKELRPLSIAGYAMTGNYPLSASHLAIVPPLQTGDDGRFTIKGVGRDRIVQLYVSGKGIAKMPLYARSRPGEALRLIERASLPELGSELYHPAEFTCIATPSVPVTGRVTDRRTGEPLAGYVVRGYKIPTSDVHGGMEAMFIHTNTDADGRYVLEGLPLGDNIFQVAPPQSSPHLASNVAITTAAGSPPMVRDVALSKGVKIRGRVTDSRAGKPLAGHLTYFAFETNPHLRDVKGFYSPTFQYRADSDGRYEIHALPGPGILAFRADNDDDYPHGIGADRIDGPKSVTNAIFFQTVPWRCTPDNFHLVTQVDPATDAAEVTLDLTLTAGATFSVRVRTEDGQPLSEYYVHGDGSYGPWRQHDGEKFDVKGYFPKDGRRVMVYEPKLNLIGYQDVTGDAPESINITLKPGGKFVGRIVDEEGLPVENLSLYSHWGNENFLTLYSPAVIKNRGELISNLDGRQVQTNKDGRFELKGIIPGLSYTAGVSGATKRNGRQQMMHLGTIFRGETALAGQTKELGDLRIKPDNDDFDSQPNPAEKPTEKPAEKPAAKPAPAPVDRAGSASSLNPGVHAGTTTIRGTVVDADDQPAAGVHVAATGWKNAPGRGGDLAPRGEILAEATTDASGRYELILKNVSTKTHTYANLIARQEGAAIAWQRLNLSAREAEVPLKLHPEEPIRGRLIDLEGRPAANLKFRVSSITKKTAGGMPDEGVGYRGRQTPAAWLSAVTSDKDGRFTIHGIPAGHGVHLEIEPSDNYARQSIALNTGMSESRGEYDGTYRSLVRNAKPGEDIVIPLPPAQIFEGTVRYEDSKQPAAHARLTIWASQQQTVGSMSSVAGQADAEGRYRIPALPGIRFGVTAFPPEGAPYLCRQTTDEIRWDTGDRVKQVDLTLPRGVLVRGQVAVAGTSQPIAGTAVQYVPEETKKSRDSDGILTGWQAIEITDSEGRFEITVLPGPGRLLAHAPGGNYILQELSSSLLSFGKPGGERQYAHAIHKLDLPANAETQEVTLELQPGAALAGRIVDGQGQPVEETIVVSRLDISPYSLEWRGERPQALGGRFELIGLAPGVEYPTYFLDAKRKLGATVQFKAGDPEPTVILEPCGSAQVRFVDATGQPVAEHHPTLHIVVTPGVHRYDYRSMQAGQLAADSDFAGNIDRLNHPINAKSDEQGRMTIRALIPGATYRLMVIQNKEFQIAKEFQAKAGETLDFGDLTVERPKDK